MGSVKGIYNLGVRDVDGTIILKWVLKMWTELTEGRNQWWAVVDMVMNIWILYSAGNSSAREQPAASQKVLCCTEQATGIGY
jgi:hypothetical protein